jgi:hypothetical protein
MDAYIEAIAVVKAHEARTRGLRETRSFGHERVLVIHILSFYGLRSLDGYYLVCGTVKSRQAFFGFIGFA